MSIVQTRTFKGTDGCYRYGTYDIVATLGDKVIYALYGLGFSDSTHQYERVYVLNGTDCKDGYSVLERCTVCDDEQYLFESNDHRTEGKESFYDADGAFCGVKVTESGCKICGSVIGTYYEELCSHDGYKLADDGTKVYTCSECGVQMHLSSVKGEKDADCGFTQIDTYTFIKDDAQLYGYVEERKLWSHDYRYGDVLMNGESCTDGHSGTMVCNNCGDTLTYTDRFDHDYHIVNTELSEYGMCAGTLTQSVCEICGDVYRLLNIELGCNMAQVSSDTVQNGDGTSNVTTVYKCTVCGARRVTVIERERLSGCRIYVKTTTAYYIGDVELYSSVNENILSDAHSFEDSIELKGESCSDGYTVSTKCTYCGYVEYSYDAYDHRMMFDDEFYNADGTICGVTVHREYCDICGESPAPTLIPNCYFSQVQYDELGTEIQKCIYCSMEWHRSFRESALDENCNYTWSELSVLYKDGEELQKYVFSMPLTAHSYEVKSVQLNGTLCTDGAYVTYACTRCGDTYSITEYDHVIIRKQTYKPCGYFVLEASECACGMGNSVSCASAGQITYESYEENGVYYSVERHVCSSCVTELIVKSYEELTDCTNSYCMVYTLRKGDEVFLEDFMTRPKHYEFHEYEETYEAINGSCANGVLVTKTCTRCGKSIQYTVNDGHNLVNNRYYALSEYGACGLSFEVCECACAERREIFRYSVGCLCNSYTDSFEEDGVEHYVVYETCMNCGINITTDRCTAVSGCTTDIYTVYTVSMNGEVLISLESAHTVTDSHVWSTDANGSKVCTSCGACGEEGFGPLTPIV